MAKDKTIRRICFDRVIPDTYQPARSMAHKAAVSHYLAALGARNPLRTQESSKKVTFAQHVSAVPDLGELNAADPVHVFRMAVINQKKWDNGYNLRCKFLDGDDQQREKVATKAKLWEKVANVTINFVEDADAEIRISFQADSGSWSAVGTDCLVTSYFPAYQPTMNFGWLRDDTENEEYERVVVHEFGHALGCIHEHQSPNEHLKWDTQAVYDTFSGPPNYWSKEDIDSNILQKYSPEGISATRFDKHSIMLYQFDASLFLDHKGTPLNTHLSQQDKRMIAEMYPQTASSSAAIGKTA